MRLSRHPSRSERLALVAWAPQTTVNRSWSGRASGSAHPPAVWMPEAPGAYGGGRWRRPSMAAGCRCARTLTLPTFYARVAPAIHGRGRGALRPVSPRGLTARGARKSALRSARRARVQVTQDANANKHVAEYLHSCAGLFIRAYKGRNSAQARARASPVPIDASPLSPAPGSVKSPGLASLLCAVWAFPGGRRSQCACTCAPPRLYPPWKAVLFIGQGPRRSVI